jgi:hypothetical protein
MIKTMSVEINKLDNNLYHSGETHLKVIASSYGIKGLGKLEAYESRTVIKANQKNNHTLWTGSVNYPGEQLLVDICLIKVGGGVLEKPSSDPSLWTIRTTVGVTF